MAQCSIATVTLAARLGSLVAFMLAGVCVPALAQDDAETETAMARVLFEEGRAAAVAEDWDLAAERFRQTLALRATPAVHYNLGISLAHSGRLLQGIEHLEASFGDPTFSVAAHELVDELRARLAHVVVRTTLADGWRVRVAERELPGGLIGSSVPVDPGPLTIELLDTRGERVGGQSVTLADGEERVIELAPDAVAAGSEGLGEPIAHGSVSRERDESGPIALTSVAALLSATGIVLVAVAGWSWSDAASAASAYEASPTLAGLHDGNARADRTEILGGLSAGTLAAATIAWCVAAQLWGDDEAPVTIGAWVSPDLTALSVGSRW